MTTRTEKLPAKSVPVSVPIREAVVRYGFVAVTVVLIGYFLISEPNFRTSSNLWGLLVYAAPVGIAGLGVTIAMTVGGLDLSVGSTAGFAVSLAAWTMVIGNQVGGVAIVVVLIAGALIGLLNAVLIVWARIPDLLATLTTMFAIMGLKLVLVDGKSISSRMTLDDGTTAPGRFTDGFLYLAQGKIGPVPFPAILLIVISVLVWFLLERTRWGRLLYAVGANPEASRLAGVRVGLYRSAAYVAAGVLASVAGLLLAARIGQGDVSAGNSLLLDAVAVALVGTSVLGRNVPNAWGTVLGAVLVTVMVVGFSMMGLPYYVQDVAKGAVLLVALLFSYTLSTRRATLPGQPT
ncbi:monosaccharide ABC transporter membrane protein, CUT2 family [Cryptosporangium aurantiacum]|uniref:Monosaccharide ABC transporter membrane protein, CUT2 family n=1 Tax=Cryptosporangium aurantiacum TaxID=134849 RepID=A0A1M7MD62_9ACTN|nr:ABC transporter permease [Cryptosporangium aurantiacum]SHM88730.1 monosaccharide ABC transporter membrane protein, CUT2 family [Cryptosporangium aurantiacum]